MNNIQRERPEAPIVAGDLLTSIQKQRFQTSFFQHTYIYVSDRIIFRTRFPSFQSTTVFSSLLCDLIGLNYGYCCRFSLLLDVSPRRIHRLRPLLRSGKVLLIWSNKKQSRCTYIYLYADTALVIDHIITGCHGCHHYMAGDCIRL